MINKKILSFSCLLTCIVIERDHCNINKKPWQKKKNKSQQARDKNKKLPVLIKRVKRLSCMDFRLWPVFLNEFCFSFFNFCLIILEVIKALN